MPNQEDDEDELTDEEIDRMIRALACKKKRKEKDFEMKIGKKWQSTLNMIKFV